MCHRIRIREFGCGRPKRLRSASEESPRHFPGECHAVSLLREEMRFLTPEQVGVLFHAASGDGLEVLYVLAVTTGLRQGELLGLKWEDVDAGTLQVKRALTMAKGGPVLVVPKTKGSRRSVELSRTASAALGGHLDRQARGEIDAAGPLWRENGLVFASEAGEPLDRRYVTTHLFKPLLRRAGLPR